MSHIAVPCCHVWQGAPVVNVTKREVPLPCRKFSRTAVLRTFGDTRSRFCLMPLSLFGLQLQFATRLTLPPATPEQQGCLRTDLSSWQVFITDFLKSMLEPFMFINWMLCWAPVSWTDCSCSILWKAVEHSRAHFCPQAVLSTLRKVPSYSFVNVHCVP